MIKEIRRLGIDRTVMLSGDNKRVASAIGSEVGIDEARAPLMPEGKVHALKELARMAQDGIRWDISVWHMYGSDPEWAFRH